MIQKIYEYIHSLYWCDIFSVPQIKKSMEGSISKERLREEVVAPYKQNWIGIFSVFIVMLSAIATKFPELLQIPVIPIPDL